MIGVWTGCGFDTIQLIFPPPNVLGYDACVGPIVSDPPEDGPFIGVPVGAEDDEEVFVIID
jgi:hypothetical protein